MKVLFYNVVLLFCTTTIVGQNSVRQDAVPATSTYNPWDLDEYIWSHTRYRSAKNDKPVLDFEALDNWASLSSDVLSISPNGKYFLYGVQNNVQWRLDTVIIQSTEGDWRVVLDLNAKAGFFSADSRQYIYQQKEQLCFIKTGSTERRSEKGVIDYKRDFKNEWLAYRLVNPDTTLVLSNLLTDKEVKINDVITYVFDRAGNWLVYQLKNKQIVLRQLHTGNEDAFGVVANYSFHSSGKWFVVKTDDPDHTLILHDLNNGRETKYADVYAYWLNDTGDLLLLNTGDSLKYIEMSTDQEKLLWTKKDKALTVQSAFFDKTGKQVVFITEDKTKQPTGPDYLTPLQSIWYWKEGAAKAEQMISNHMPGFEKSTIIANGILFTEDGRYLWFKKELVKPKPGKPLPGAIQLDVWSYQDKVLQSAQPFQKETYTRSVILDLEAGQIVYQERDYEKVEDIKGHYATVKKNNKEMYGDRFWEKGYYEDSAWLIDLRNGDRRNFPVLPANGINLPTFTFSPDGLYLLYFDAAKGCNYFSYELATGKIVNVSEDIPTWQLGITRPFVLSKEIPAGGSGIIKRLHERKAFLVSDKFGDIWQLDFCGKKPPICITNGYGKLHDITFHWFNTQDLKTDTLLFAAFNRRTKMQGFYRIVTGTNSTPELLSMNSCEMGVSRYQVDRNAIIKAQDTNTWIVKRQTATQAPNYFVTNDLKKFLQLTRYEPHKKYNWLSAELHSFKQLDGTLSQGVLYKSENFDPSKKYPVIVTFYVNLSDQLFHYPAADYINCPSIYDAPAWMVSHGYLVFIPDIYFTKDQWGPSTVNTIDGAARYLANLPYVDGKHIGAAGHSNSGRFGYYLLTHSKLFSAMSIGSGFTGGDVLSGALSLELGGGGKSCLEVAEVSAYGTALGNVWENKERWIDHIAPLQADKAVSPFLLFHNKKDGDDVRLAVELFLAFRRLEKKCWWLQYDDGFHTLGKLRDLRDFTIRYTQFFDHYLKGAPAPEWMSKGIAANRKGIDLGYKHDPGGSCAMKGKNSCEVCGKWKKGSPGK